MARFLQRVSTPIVDLSPVNPKAPLGLLVTEYIQIDEAQPFVVTKLLTPKNLISGKFVARHLSEIWGLLLFTVSLFLKFKVWFIGVTILF